MFLRNYKYTIILVLVILVVVGYGGWKWYENKMNLVERGMADPKFPYHEYTLLELARQGKLLDLDDEHREKLQQEIKNLPTRTTPQETFDKYVQALKDGDIEEALEYFLEDEREQKRIRDILYDNKKEGKLGEMIRITENVNLQVPWDSERIERNSVGKVNIYYSFPCVYDKLATCNIGFSKDLYGDWKISDL